MSFDLSVFSQAQNEAELRGKAHVQSIPRTTRCAPANLQKLVDATLKAYPELKPAPEMVLAAGRRVDGPIMAAAFKHGNTNVVFYTPKPKTTEGSVVWTNLEPITL